MDCETFQKEIVNFIFDKIEYSEDLEMFLKHAKECKECREELELYYSIHRGLEDVSAPTDDEFENTNKELEFIFNYYNDYFKKQRRMNIFAKISIGVFILVIIGLIVYVAITMI